MTPVPFFRDCPRMTRSWVALALTRVRSEPAMRGPGRACSVLLAARRYCQVHADDTRRRQEERVRSGERAYVLRTLRVDDVHIRMSSVIEWLGYAEDELALALQRMGVSPYVLPRGFTFIDQG